MDPFDRLDVVVADLTTLRVDALVNAANEALLGGGGVDGAIHRAAGPRLLEACRALPELRPGVRCPTGDARLTPGFDLHARFVVHAVGPVWSGGDAEEPRLLQGCYVAAVRLAEAAGARTLAFPSISTGAYGYPADQAARVAVRATTQALASHPGVARVTFCCFSEASAAAHRAAVAEHRRV